MQIVRDGESNNQIRGKHTKKVIRLALLLFFQGKLNAIGVFFSC